MRVLREKKQSSKVTGFNGLIPVLEVFELPAPYPPFNPVFLGQLSGDDFTNSSTRQEPAPDFEHIDSIPVTGSQ
jgi:hypothetical protein